MPIDFPDDSLVRTAEMWKFRPRMEGETLDTYRKELAKHVRPKDFIESYEIEFGVGWDKWSPDQKKQMLAERMG